MATVDDQAAGAEAGKGKTMLSPGLHNIDVLQALKEYPDKYFDLAIADPPYGEGSANPDFSRGGWNRFGQRFDKYKPAALHIRAPEEGQKLREPAEHGRRNTEKNHCVGRGARTGVF